MAVRPWVTPQEVKDYSDNQNVKDRADSKLAVDISRAEMYVIAYTHNDFSDSVKYPVAPESVKTAVILIAEVYANNAKRQSSSAYKSESFDDYSYTVADINNTFDNLWLGSLLDEFIEDGDKSHQVFLRMRKL